MKRLILVLAVSTLTGCAGIQYRPNGGTRAFQDFLGSGPQQPAQQAYNCQTRPVYGPFGETLRTETVCQ